jgi:hypothetical protein
MPVGGNMRLGVGRKVDKRTGEKENYVTGYKQYSKECTKPKHMAIANTKAGPKEVWFRQISER